MKSVKPGRGPSALNAVGSVVAILFGIGWMIAVASMGGGAFALFGLLFIISAVAHLVYNLKNAAAQNRYSEYDITDDDEEPDPFNERFAKRRKFQELRPRAESQNAQTLFCPYCGSPAEKDFSFCRTCGRQLPGDGE